MQIPLANIHWRFLLVRDDWGFQVNPLCRHDITRSDRQIGKFDSPQKAEDFISSLSQQQMYADALRGGRRGNRFSVSPAQPEGLVGRDGGGPSCPGVDGGRMDLDTC